MEVFQILSANELLVLLCILGLGLLLGNISIKGVGLGSSGVIFVALLAGHLGLSIPGGTGRLGLALFVYCVGIGAGGRFFEALAREGGTLARLAVLIVGSGAFIAWAAAQLFDIPGGLATGLFAGALTSTPALAAATEDGGEFAQQVAVGFGVAYPFGVVGVVLFVQLLPRIVRKGGEEAPSAEAEPDKGIGNALVEVGNPNLYGRAVFSADVAGISCCQISRVLAEGRLRPLEAGDVFSPGQVLLLVGRPRSIQRACEFIGRRVEMPYVLDTENERRRLAVTRSCVAGRTLRELAAMERHGVVVTRVTRMDQTFVPDAETRIEKYDILTVVGRPGDLNGFSERVGHRPQALDYTDLVSLALGMSLGLLLGMLPLGFEGAQMTLGVAGGPLFAGLILGRMGRIGKIVGHIPRPTRLLLQEFGLVLFLADAGISGGRGMVDTISHEGPVLLLAGAVVTLLPLLIAYPYARRLMKMSRMQALGGICGGMTSTPALGALTAGSDSQEPVVSYATAYPVALIMMTVAAKMLGAILGGA